MSMHRPRNAAVAARLAPVLATGLAATAALAGVEPRPAVIVAFENLAPDAGTFQTPVWVGFHDGSFDLYDTGAPADSLPVLGSPGLERIAEDGNPMPLSDDFTMVVPAGVQGVVTSNGPIPPLAPGQLSARLFEIDPKIHRYFSFASMVIPSNDAFIANGDPTAHPLFDENGSFVGGAFVVAGMDVNDAGTEVNDEIPEHTAFFGQMMADAGVEEDGDVGPHPGYNPVGSGGILDDPMFANADFLAPGYEMMRVRLIAIDLAAETRFAAKVTPEQAVPRVESNALGTARLTLGDAGTTLTIDVQARALTGPVTVAHLHLARRGQTGPVVVDLGPGIDNMPGGQTTIQITVGADDVTGPLGDTDDPFGNLVAELVSTGVYVNLHTAAHPGGEIRGQLSLR